RAPAETWWIRRVSVMRALLVRRGDVPSPRRGRSAVRWSGRPRRRPCGRSGSGRRSTPRRPGRRRASRPPRGGRRRDAGRSVGAATGRGTGGRRRGGVVVAGEVPGGGREGGGRPVCLGECAGGTLGGP